MPARTRRSAGASAPNAGRDEEASSPLTQQLGSSPPPPVDEAFPVSSSGLKFNQSLSWRAGRPIPVAELLKRLQALAHEMKDMEQEDDESVKASLGNIAKELADQQLLGHKDRGVKAWVACCAVDVLRLCAPDAPFTSKQLRAIFEMIVKFVLPALSDPSQPYNSQHMYVLQSLAQVKSIVLVTDVPRADDLITHIFTTFFDIVSGSSKASTGEQIPKAVHFNMTSILVILVDEAPALPQDAIDIVVAQFLRLDPRVMSVGGDKLKKGSVEGGQPIFAMKELPPAYMMAKTICLSCQNKMSREISKYFNDVIMDASGSSSDRRDSGEGDDPDTVLNDDNLRELDKAHRLLRELWRACPLVLQDVVPQLEAELAADNVRLRVLATEALGDITSGIGAAGPPPPPAMDPAAYPPVELSSSASNASQNLLTKPSSPQSFSQVHTRAYSSFLSRKQDKSPLVRSSWAIAVGRILVTSAGGMGLSQDEELRFVEDMARMLNDSDEKVRLAAVQAVGAFGIKDVINKLGLSGGVNKPGSVLGNLAERVKDRKSAVRNEAMTVFCRIWAVASGEIAAGNKLVEELVGGIPSKVLNTYYTNDQEIILLMDKVLFEILLPLQYPPLKLKSGKQPSGASQRVKDSQDQTNGVSTVQDPDQIRAERVMLLAKGLDERAKKIFFALSQRQVSMTRFIQVYLQSSEEYNGGVMDENEITIKERLKKLINELTKLFPDPSKVSADLWKFAKTHDRRAYQLIRFCCTPASDYRTVYNAIKEFSKRIDISLKDTLLPLLYRTSIILYNRSHVPAILEYSRTNEKDFSNIAHELLADISSRVPEVLKAQVREICVKLQDDAPSTTKSNSPNAVDDLKACASFAKKFPNEIPQDRKFVQAMASFALYGSPPEAAKHAVSIVMSASDRKEMLAKDLVHKCVRSFTYGEPGFLAKMAAVSRLWLLAPNEVDNEADTIIDFAVKEILLKNRSPSSDTPSKYEWSDRIEEECAAKCWAIRLLVNRVRSHATVDTLSSVIEPVYSLLNKLIESEGELSKSRDTPEHYRPRLRLLAANSLLKLCQSKRHDALFLPQSFHKLAEVAQDNIYEVREPFLARLRKYLSRNSLPARFYTIPFLLAHEPVLALKQETMTWLKSRATVLASFQNHVVSTSKEQDAKTGTKKATILETVFSRLLSLLAHHPDYEDEGPELVDMSRYLVFYLSTVANDQNISLIYHIAQRVKSSEDVVVLGSSSTDQNVDYTTRLHTLSDLATYTIRTFLEAHNWNLQSLPGRVSLPSSLFGEIKDHDASMSVLSKNFLPEGVEAGVDGVVRQSMKKPSTANPANKKRKSESEQAPLPKKARMGKLPVREREKEKTKKPAKRKARNWNAASDNNEDDGETRKNGRATGSTSRRKSDRTSLSAAKTSYRERDDSEDDAEMEEANEEQESDDDLEDDGEDESDDANAPKDAEEDVNGAEGTEMKDADQQDEQSEGDIELVSSPLTPASHTRPSHQAAPVSEKAAETPPEASKRTPRSAGSARSAAKSNSKATSSPAQSSPAAAKGKKATAKKPSVTPAATATGRVTRSRG